LHKIDPQILLNLSFPDAMTYIKALNAGERERDKARLVLEYSAVLWNRCEANKFPKLEDLLKDFEEPIKKKTEQTPEQMLEIVKALNAKWGGT
jgi:hypothetical protein